MIGNRNVDFKFEGSQNVEFHGNHLMSLKTLLTSVQELIEIRWVGLLQVEKRESHQAKIAHSSLCLEMKSRGEGVEG